MRLTGRYNETHRESSEITHLHSPYVCMCTTQSCAFPNPHFCKRQGAGSLTEALLLRTLGPGLRVLSASSFSQQASQQLLQAQPTPLLCLSLHLENWMHSALVILLLIFKTDPASQRKMLRWRVCLQPWWLAATPHFNEKQVMETLAQHCFDCWKWKVFNVYTTHQEGFIDLHHS